MFLSRLTTSLLIAFLLGITAHSIVPYAHVSPWWMTFGLAGSVVALLLSREVSSIEYRVSSKEVSPHSRYPILDTRYWMLCIFAFTLGLYRFSLTQPSLPRGLVFASPKGLAISVGTPRTANHLDPRHWLARARTTSTISAHTRFPPDQAALLTGLLYGARDFSKSDKLAFRHAGLTHIIAVSGANMTIIVVLVMRLLLALHFSRRQAFFTTVIAIMLFTLFVGPSASVIRAALMGILVEMAPLVGRLVRPTRLLLLSAAAFVLWHPWSLAFDPSFALSFLAMTGLLTWGRWLDRIILDSRFPILSRSTTLREIITSTLSATVMTAPYAAWAFGNVTLWSLPTGLLVLPLIPWTMAIGSISLIISSLFVIPTAGLLSIILWIARLPDRLHIGFFDHTFLSFPNLCAIYFVIFFLWRGIHRVKKYPQTRMLDAPLSAAPITRQTTSTSKKHLDSPLTTIRVSTR